VVLTVRVELPLVTVLNEQVGAGVPPPVMELQLKATLPVKPFTGVMVMVEVADAPGETVAGESAVAATVKPGAVLAVTVNMTVAVWLGAGVPVIVTVEVPAGVDPVVEIVRVSSVDEPGVTGLAGLNPQVAPVGRPEQERVTGLLNPPWAASVRAYEALPPAVTVSLVGASAVKV
jgi:hypothetical protein